MSNLDAELDTQIEQLDELIDAPEPTDRFQITMAILIAVVAIAGALVAWRAALIDAQAGDADFAGLAATIKAAEVKISTTNFIYEHYRGYTVYTRHREMQRLLEEEIDFDAATDVQQQAWAVSSQLASESQNLFLGQYLNTDGSYNIQRQYDETWAEEGQRQDLTPAPHFASADSQRAKSALLIGIFIIQAIALLCFTVAEGLNPARNLTRYSIGLAGIVILVVSIVLAVQIEFG